MYQQQWNDLDEYFEKYNPATNPEEYTNFGYYFRYFPNGWYVIKGRSGCR
jgi:hypothetical protein